MQTRMILSADGTKLNFGTWNENGRPALIFGGLAEYLGRYEHVAAALKDVGFAVHGVEPRGHGDSEGKKSHVMAWSEYVEDLWAGVRAVGRPLVLVTHSTGGLIALDGLRNPPADISIQALSLSAPNLEVAVQAPKLKVAGAKLLSRLFPGLPLANEIPPDHISHDETVVKAYASDPKLYDKITPRWYTELLKAQERVQAAAESFATPALLQVGTGDRIVSAQASLEFGKRYGGKLEVKSYEGLYHEIYNERPEDRARTIADLCAWCKALA